MALKCASGTSMSARFPNPRGSRYWRAWPADADRRLSLTHAAGLDGATDRAAPLAILQNSMPIAERLDRLRRGFHRTFWIANTLELFERFAFYGSKAVLTVYLAEKVGLGPQVAAALVGTFSGVLYALPVLAGTLVDRYGFKKTLSACFFIFTIGYFLIGLAGLAWGQHIADAVGRTPYMIAVLLLTAIGGSLIKPCIVGTV